MDANTRRLEINLMTLGTGISLFGLWAFVRSGLTLFILRDQINTLIGEENRLLIYLIVFGAVAILCLMYFYIGMSARAEGKGKHKSILYLILTGINLCLYLPALIPEFFSLFSGTEEEILSVVISILIDITTIVCMVEMMIIGIRLRRIRKNMSIQEKGGATD